jgi:hypothetical protein
MSSSDTKTDAVKQTEHQLGISSSNASVLQKQGEESGGRRGKSYGDSSIRIANEQEEKQLTESADASFEKRRHVTDSISKNYGSK